jgi:phage-related protein
MKPLEFLGSSKDDLDKMPSGVRHDMGLELMRVQFGGDPKDFKPFAIAGPGSCEIRTKDASGIYRVIYVAKFDAAVYVLHAFQKKTQKTSKLDIAIAQARYKLIGGERK